jgi:hypothetical protein
MELLQALCYLLPGALIAGLAVHAAIALSAIFTQLRLKAAEKAEPMPPLVRAYFRNTVRVLFVSAALFIVLAGADGVLHVASPDAVVSRALGYASGLALLICSFALMIQGGVDRHLKLLPRRSRVGQTIGGVAGVATAAWGMVLVTLEGGVWG